MRQKYKYAQGAPAKTAKSLIEPTFGSFGGASLEHFQKLKRFHPQERDE